MIMGSDALSAFQTSAGVATDKLSTFIRTVLVVLTFLWAAWCVLGEINHYRHHEIEIDLAFRKIMRVLFVVTIMVILVFI